MEARLDRRALLRAATLAALARNRPSRAQSAAGLIPLPGVVRVGILGLEGHYGEVIRAAEILPALQIVAVTAASGRERALIAPNKYLAAARVYHNHEQMLNSHELDVACVANEHGGRAEAVIACARRGIPVAAEKPLALTLAELQAVKNAVAQFNARLTMLLPMRFDAPYLVMKSIVESGEIGEPVTLSGQKSYQLGERPEWMKHRASYGGTIPHIAVHLVDLMRFTSGREMVEAAAFHSRVGFESIGEMENNAVISYRLDNGGTASIRLDYLRPSTAPSHGDDRLRIAGTKGVVEYQQGELTLVTEAKPLHRISELPERLPLFADFLDSLYNGKQHLIPVEDAYRATEIVLRTREAAETGRVVKL